MRFDRGPGRAGLAGVLLLAWLLGVSGRPASAADSPSTGYATTAPAVVVAPWRGGVSLYRPGVFTTQRTWLWCTAADIQISRNIVDHRSDHTTSGQKAYFNWMRAHNRYRLPLSAGVDAQGWAEGFRHFVDSRYRLYASATFDAALRAAVTNLRKTNLPVGITVDRGNHAWLVTGFTATADPAVTAHFTVTSVRVVGPLYGLQSKNGYDMPPNTRLTPAQLRHFFTTWHYAPTRMVWDGKYVSIQPVATKAVTVSRPTPKPTARTTPRSTPKPTPKATPRPTSTPAPAHTPPDTLAVTPAPSAAPTPAGPASAAPSHGPEAVVVAGTTPAAAASADYVAVPVETAPSGMEFALATAMLALLVSGFAGIWMLARRR